MTANLLLEREFYKQGAPMVSSTIKNRVEGPAETWPEDITTALFSEHPYLSEYEPEIEEVRVDPEEGYMLGYAIIGDDDDAGEQEKNEIKIPIFVRDWDILPFATFAKDDEIFPLTEERIREAMLSQAAVDAVPAGDPDVQDMLQEQDLQPPDHMNHYGNRYISTKLSSIRESDIMAMIKEARKSPFAARFIKKMVGAEKKRRRRDRQSIMKTSSELGGHHDTFLIEPSVGHRYSVRSMSAALRKEAAKSATRKEISILPSEIVKQANVDGYAVVGGPGPVLDTDVFAEAQEVDKTGEWMVKTNVGETLVGYVITRVLDFTGITLPMKIFFNGKNAAAQEEIAGKWVGEFDLPAPDIKPSGECVFLCTDPVKMDVMCTTPFVVQGEAQTNYGPGWAVETYLGDRVTIVRCDVIKPTEIEEDVFLVPASYSLKCIAPPEGRVDLVATPGEFEAFHAMGSKEAARLLGDGSGSYSLVGSGFNDQFIDTKEAHFKLAAVGAPDPKRLLKKADVLGTVILYGDIQEDITEDVYGEYGNLTKHAEEVCATLKGDPALLVRTAEALFYEMAKHGEVRSETIDSILSLGFVNPENTRNYVEAESDLEDAQKTLASLVVASQMGYSELPMNDAIGAMKSMEKVLEGVRKLKTGEM